MMIISKTYIYILLQAVNSPLHYSTIVTRQRSMAMISFVWMTSFIMSIPVLVGLVRLDDVQPHNNETFLLLPPTPYEDQEDQQYWTNLSYRFAIFLYIISFDVCEETWHAAHHLVSVGNLTPSAFDGFIDLSARCSVLCAK